MYPYIHHIMVMLCYQAGEALEILFTIKSPVLLLILFLFFLVILLDSRTFTRRVGDNS